MTGRDEVFERIRSLLAGQRFAVLATLSGVDPYCTLVGYSESEDCGEILFATLRDTRKYGNISRNSNVSILIDDRNNDAGDLKDAEALTVLGVAGEVPPELSGPYRTRYLDKHPYLKEFVSAPDCALISVKVSRYILVSNFQNVFEYTVS
ncbi:MAG TPA: pyridoxamine 5'-phosphate oxidase family protein [Candidatus Krumholzibacterium sp.]|nr:pyridoxamine 5'-phosphate oxidase family protein [Candidatus Krumholzibacterium sp.]